MLCHDFQNEIEKHAPLSAAARLHMSGCTNCKTLFSRQTRVWQVIDSLPRVEAPADFDFRLKARFAAARAKDFRPRPRFALRYAVPVFAAALIAVLFFAGRDFLVTPPTAPLTAENASNTDAVSFSAPKLPAEVAQNEQLLESGSENQPAAAVSDKALPAATEVPALVVAAGNRQKSVKEPARNDFLAGSIGGGSLDSGVREGEIKKLPPGIKLAEAVPSPITAPPAKPVSADEILTLIGIETVTENGKRMVKAVKSNSAAERSGVRPGDQVEAIDDQPLGRPVRSVTIKGYVLKVWRDGKIIDIPLRTEPR